MKFDYVIGNPPYQDETTGDNTAYAPPVYDRFIDAAHEIADKAILIHPARFLFNAGSEKPLETVQTQLPRTGKCFVSG